MKTCALVCLLSLLCTFAWAEPLSISLIQLIANPKSYDGKVVRVIGFVKLQFEGNAVYLHQEDFQHGLTRNGLWLDASGDLFRNKKTFDEKYVLLEGTFSAKETGHLGLWSGSLQEITRCQVWR